MSRDAESGQEEPHARGRRSMVDSMLRIPEQRPLQTLIGIGVLFVIAYGVGLVGPAKRDARIMVGDALGHYVQLRSAVFDRDLEFRNEFARMYGLDEGSAIESAAAAERSTPTGKTRNYMPVGPALLWAPAFLLVTAVVWLYDALGGAYPLDGYALAFQAAAGVTGIIAATAGSCFAYLAAAAVFDRRAAIWATLAVWLSSSALYYSLISPAYSHAASMLTVGAFWLVWIRTAPRQDLRRYASLGLLAGLSALMRWQDMILLLVPLLDVLWHRRALGFVAACSRIAVIAVAAAVAFVPQMIVWQVLYGRAFTVPQGPGFMHWQDPALLAVLFSQHGLLTWTPILAMAIVGIAFVARRAPLVFVAAVLVLATSWYVNAAVADWWAGEAFGARRFVSCYSIFVLGVTACFAQRRLSTRGMAGVTAAFAAYTLLLLLQYQTFMHGLRQVAPYPEGFVNLWLWRFRTPFDLLAWWVRR